MNRAALERIQQRYDSGYSVFPSNREAVKKLLLDMGDLLSMIGEKADTLAKNIALLDQIKAEHPDDSYGSCVVCFEKHTDDGRQAWPCATLRLVQQLENLLREVL